MGNYWILSKYHECILFFSRTHNSYKMREYTFIVLPKYSIIFPPFINITIPSRCKLDLIMSSFMPIIEAITSNTPQLRKVEVIVEIMVRSQQESVEKQDSVCYPYLSNNFHISNIFMHFLKKL